MKQKIAVVNFMELERTVLAQALSCVSGYPLIQNRNLYEWIKLLQMDERKMYGFKNQFLLVSASVIERIRSEYTFSEFIANGAVFSEVLSLQSKIHGKTAGWKKPKEIEMIEILSDITGRYAALHYDPLIHIRNNDSNDFDRLSVGFYEKHNITFKLYDGDSDMKDIIESIIRDVGIPVILSSEYAIYKAVRLVTFTNVQ